MTDARKALAAIAAKAKSYVDAQRKLHPTARVATAEPLKSAAAFKEAEISKALNQAPAFAAPRAVAQVRLLFVCASPLPDDSAAGKLLIKITQAMGIERGDAAVCVVSELAQRLPELKPKALVALGEEAAKAMLNSAEPMAKLRGRFAEYQGLTLMPTHHPAEILKNEGLKRAVWEDMKLVAATLKP